METLMIKSRLAFQQNLRKLNASTAAAPPPTPPTTKTTTEAAKGASSSSSGSGAEPPRRPSGGDDDDANDDDDHGVTAPPTPPPSAEAAMARNLTEHLATAAAAVDATSAIGGLAGAEDARPPPSSTATAASAATVSDYFFLAAAATVNASDLGNATANGTSVPRHRGGGGDDFWFCAEWVAAQHDLFQAANLCFAMAFLAPKGFKRGALVVRALAAAGFVLLAAWAGTELCAPDALAWNVALAGVNSVHTIMLIVRFLPPALTLELTELYLRLFKPFKVNKKHFKELAREGRLLRLEPGEPYAVEGVTPADERLSILLKGKLKVSCEQTVLHFIQPHQFVDSPEWEANREQSDDVFQVTIVAEEGSTYLCWPRMRLERVLRHRPMLKVVLDSLIGKDITHKLYSLNEQQLLYAAEPRVAPEPRIMLRSLSADAVDVGTRGKMRSLEWKSRERRGHVPTADKFSHTQPPSAEQWKPVATQFPPQSPFPSSRAPTALLPRIASQAHQFDEAPGSSAAAQPSCSSPLLGFPSPPAPKRGLLKAASFRRSKHGDKAEEAREVKFVEPLL